MNHVVYLDAKSNELENLLSGKKSMIIRGATGRKVKDLELGHKRTGSPA